MLSRVQGSISGSRAIANCPIAIRPSRRIIIGRQLKKVGLIKGTCTVYSVQCNASVLYHYYSVFQVIKHIETRI